MSRPFWCVASLLALAVFGSGQARADDQERIQGSWKTLFAEIGSKEKSGPKLKETELVIEGSKFTILEGDRKEVVHFTLDPDAKPRHIDFYRASDSKEKLWHGIYAFEGKDLKLCWGPAGAERPKDFGAKKSDHNRYLVVKKK